MDKLLYLTYARKENLFTVCYTIYMKEDQFALLKVIEATMVDIKEDVKDIKNSLKSKVEHADFHALKGEVEDLKKSKWTITGMALAGSYIISHFFK